MFDIINCSQVMSSDLDIEISLIEHLQGFFWDHVFVVIILMCLTRTWDYQIHGFDWLKSILTVV